MRPFVIFALPRSRTFWLSRFLSGDGALKPCGHDIGSTLNTLADVRAALSAVLAGSVETGAATGWRWLRKNFPEARFVVIRRPVEAVRESLARCGLDVPRSLLDLQAAFLDEISGRCGTTTLNATDLDSAETCSALFQLCRGVAPSAAWLALNVGANIQLDMNRRIAHLQARSVQIDGLKAEAELADRKLRTEALPFVEIKSVPWSEAIEREMLPLAHAHFDEANHDSPEHRPFDLDCLTIRQIQAAGLMQLNAAWVDGEMAAYCTWTLGPDPESRKVLIANQGPWFVRDDPNYRGLKLGTTLFRRSLDDLRARGVKCVYPHHPMFGRGTALGAYFKRLGAIEMQRVYSLWIGD